VESVLYPYPCAVTGCPAVKGDVVIGHLFRSRLDKRSLINLRMVTGIQNALSVAKRKMKNSSGQMISLW